MAMNSKFKERLDNGTLGTFLVERVSGTVAGTSALIAAATIALSQMTFLPSIDGKINTAPTEPTAKALAADPSRGDEGARKIISRCSEDLASGQSTGTLSSCYAQRAQTYIEQDTHSKKFVRDVALGAGVTAIFTAAIAGIASLRRRELDYAAQSRGKWEDSAGYTTIGDWDDQPIRVPRNADRGDACNSAFSPPSTM